MALLIELRHPTDSALLEAAVECLLAHHDALRLRFARESGDWRQWNTPTEAQPVFVGVDLAALPQEEQTAAIAAKAAELQTSLNLGHGPLLRVAHIDLGPDRPAHLLLIAHHLAVDGVSWRILLEDLQTAYKQLERGETAALPAKTTSFRRWAQRLVEFAEAEAVRGQASYWLAEAAGPLAPLPRDGSGGANSEASLRRLTRSLSREETHALLHEVPAAYRTRIDEVLLTALLQAAAAWTDSPTLLLDFEGHGREDLVGEVDLSRTVGWFTTLFPLRLELEAGASEAEALMAVKDQLRRVAHGGIGWGLLRYLSRDVDLIRQLASLPQPELSFNYLGQFDTLFAEGSLFAPSLQEIGLTRDPAGARRHLLDVTGAIVDRRLEMVWLYSKNIHRQPTIEDLANGFMKALRTLIAHCRSLRRVRYTPGDFPLAQLNQGQLDKIISKFVEE
jgi:non-ribosomal peptide synthase protein (TIGR01720 family)